MRNQYTNVIKTMSIKIIWDAEYAILEQCYCNFRFQLSKKETCISGHWPRNPTITLPSNEVITRSDMIMLSEMKLTSK